MVISKSRWNEHESEWAEKKVFRSPAHKKLSRNWIKYEHHASSSGFTYVHRIASASADEQIISVRSYKLSGTNWRKFNLGEKCSRRILLIFLRPSLISFWLHFIKTWKRNDSLPTEIWKMHENLTQKMWKNLLSCIIHWWCRSINIFISFSQFVVGELCRRTNFNEFKIKSSTNELSFPFAGRFICST